jgi:preprotein translocase subunit SecD
VFYLEHHFTISCLLFPKKDGIHISLKLTNNNNQNSKELVDYTKEIIYKRARKIGVRCVEITSNEDYFIFVKLPGMENAQKAERLLMTGNLEFKIVDETSNLNAALKDEPPSGRQILFEVDEDSTTPYLVIDKPILTGEYIRDAKVQIDSQYKEPYIAIDFDKKGSFIFAQATEQNIKRRLAIIIDNNVFSAPVIQEKIIGGSVRITGRFSIENALSLVAALKHGPLPSKIEIIEITRYHDSK